MKLEWEEILIESKTGSASSKISPIETVYATVPLSSKKKRSKLIYFVFIALVFYQILIAYFTKFFDKDELQLNLKNTEKYLDILEDTISSDMFHILQDAKKYWSILKLAKVENSYKLDKIYFSQNETYLYFAVFQVVGKEIYSRLEFFNYHLFGDSKIPFEEFSEKIDGIEISFLSAIETQPYLYNLAGKKDKSEFCIAIIPLEKQILALGFNNKKWNELLSKGQGTYFLLNHEGVVLAHSSLQIQESVVSHPSFDFLRKGDLYKKKEFISSSGKVVKIFTRKLIPFESYLVYLLEIDDAGDNKFYFYFTLSLLGYILVFFILIRLNK